jgi:type VI secretion system Hcp family effector
MNARRFWTGLAMSLFLTLWLQPTWAQTTGIFVEILGPPIPGEALQSEHVDWIEALGCAEALLNEGTVGPAIQRPAAPEFAAIICTKLIDLASPLLRIDAAQGLLHDSVTIDFVRGEPESVFFQIELAKVAITEVSMAATVGNKPEGETVKFAFDTICWTYFGGDAVLEKCWDVVNNQEFTP